MAEQITKGELILEIQDKIDKYEEVLEESTFSSEISDSTNRVAISNLYLALATLFANK